MKHLKELFYFLKEKHNYFILAIIGLLIASISVIVFYKINVKDNSNITEIKEEAESLKQEDTDKQEDIDKKEVTLEFRVEIKGEVKNPGVYTINSDKRIIDVINKAGGLTKSADISIINQSKKIKDEMVIIIYSKNEVASFLKNKEIDKTKIEICTKNAIINNDACITEEDLNISNSTSNQDFSNINDSTNNSNNKKISINTASITELITLTGIGESKAKSIIDYREKEGPFKDIKDITNVSGIGDSLFEKIKDYITI